jgi:predicted PurR-regulated permease PerM
MTAPTAPTNLVRPLTYLALAAAFAYLLYLLSPILTPFLLAIALSYFGDPWVDRLQRLRVPRALAALLVMLALLLAVIALILLLAPLVHAQFELLLQRLPALLGWADQTLLPWLRQTLGLDLPADRAHLGGWLREHLKDLGGFGASVPQLADRGFALVGFLAGLLLVPVVMFYLLRDWDRILSQLAGWIPRPIRPRLLTILGEIDAVLAQFVRAHFDRLTLPSLYLHGTADPFVTVEGTKLVYERAAAADKTMKLYDGLYHEILNEAERGQVLADISAWLDAHLPPRPAAETGGG